MIFRDYKKETDRKDIQRLWMECGWIEDEDKEKEALDIFMSTSRCKVVEHKKSAECLVITSPGKMNYGGTNLSISAVSSVTVGRLLRKQGAAPKLLASMLADEIEKGTAVAGLGMFEQGFYNRLGFATMGYEHWFSFDPSKLKIYKKGGIPFRLGVEDYLEAHSCFGNAKKEHGFVTLDPPELFQAEMMWTKNGFGLGYKTEGTLSHYLWMGTENAEAGPYEVHFMAYKNWNQFLQLMGILKSLEEQVRTVRMKEPAFIQLQDFIEKPFQLQTITSKSKYESKMKSIAYQQLRICNLEKCIEAVHYDGPEFSFNLQLSDPINKFLDDSKKKNQCQGKFTVTIGKNSSIKRNFENSLPVVNATINAFTRLWIGLLPAETIGLVEKIEIENDLKIKLTKAFYNPDVRSDWDY